MKNYFRYFILFILVFSIFVNARIDYDERVYYVNNYIYNFTKCRDYIYLSEKFPYIYENDEYYVGNEFNSGGSYVLMLWPYSTSTQLVVWQVGYHSGITLEYYP